MERETDRQTEAETERGRDGFEYVCKGEMIIMNLKPRWV